ncbi:MAG: hypothetical protein NTY20_03510 [Candidatus Aenigmarchaeota archaeon]|nr:hypothetical protein [Candidatus Aenigmarchaeota archaeon]
MYIKGEPYLIFGSFPEEYHKSIIRRTALALEKECPEEQIGSKTFPSLKSGWYEIPGMGKARISPKEREAIFYMKKKDYVVYLNGFPFIFEAYSMDYDLGTDEEHLDKIKLFYPEWNIKKE